MSKPQAENEATRIPQPGAERGPELERQIIALVDFIEEILKTEKSRLLQVAGLAALEIGSTLQWDYEENGKLQDKIVLKFEGKKKSVPLPAAWKRPFPLRANICQVRALIMVSQSYIMQLSQVNLNS